MQVDTAGGGYCRWILVDTVDNSSGYYKWILQVDTGTLHVQGTKEHLGTAWGEGGAERIYKSVLSWLNCLHLARSNAIVNLVYLSA